MWTLRNIAGGVLSVLVLGGCAADPTNDPRAGGFFGGVRGLAAGDYDMRQQALQGQRDDSLNQLSALQEEGEALETERQMKASEVAAQRRQLAALKARNRELAGRINQLQRSKAATEQRTAELRHKQQRLTRGIQEFETQLDRGQLTAAQADSKRLSLERQYDAIKDL
jgi:chromosome segregation ATPase